MDKEGVEKLAQLSRLKLTEQEISKYAKEISEILDYVDLLKEAGVEEGGVIESTTERNVLTEDSNPHEKGKNTKELIESAPESEKGYVKVKKIL